MSSYNHQHQGLPPGSADSRYHQQEAPRYPPDQTGSQLASIPGQPSYVRISEMNLLSVRCVADSQGIHGPTAVSHRPTLLFAPAGSRESGEVDHQGILHLVKASARQPVSLHSRPYEPTIKHRACNRCRSRKNGCVFTESDTCERCTISGTRCEGGQAAHDPSMARTQTQSPSAAAAASAPIFLVSCSCSMGVRRGVNPIVSALKLQHVPQQSAAAALQSHGPGADDGSPASPQHYDPVRDTSIPH
jgi:hypothetical protein